MPGRGEERCSQDHAAKVLARAMAGVAAGLAGIVTGGRNLGNLHEQVLECAVLAVVTMGIDRQRRAQNQSGDEKPGTDGSHPEPGFPSFVLRRCHSAGSPRFIDSYRDYNALYLLPQRPFSRSRSPGTCPRFGNRSSRPAYFPRPVPTRRSSAGCLWPAPPRLR